MPNPLFDALFANKVNNEQVLLHLVDGTKITAKKMLDETMQFANAITDLGLKAGDRMVLQIDKSYHALALYGAAIMTGVVFIPLNTAYTKQEVEYFLSDSQAKLFLCTPNRLCEFETLDIAKNLTIKTLDTFGEGSFAQKAKAMPKSAQMCQRTCDDIAAILYTSGTTGRSKGAMLSHKNLLSNAQTLTHIWRFDHRDVLMHALPIFHTHGLFVACNIALLTNASMIFLNQFNTNDVIRNLPKATSMMGVPTFYTRLLDAPDFTKECTKHMRLFISGSAPLLEETHHQFFKRTGHHILERYGMTETNMSTSNPYNGTRKPGTVGPPLPDVQLRIVHPKSNITLSSNETGLIEVKGPNVFKGYWKMPQKTAEEFCDDGYFKTGDLGFIDDQGYVTIVGRNKDLIISGGYNIYPKEIEQVIDEHPDILESAVIGIKHSDFGETPIAILVPTKNSKPDPEKIAAFVASKIASFKRPTQWIIVEQLPRNTMGKVQKNILRDTYNT